jgi:predicted permease
MSLGRFSDRPQIGGAEYAFALVYGILTIVVGVVIATTIGLPKPWFSQSQGGLIVIAMISSLWPFPERLRDQRFWIKRSVVYLAVNVTGVVLLAYLYSLSHDGSLRFLTSLAISTAVVYVILAVPRLFTERAPGAPRFSLREVVLAIIFSVFIHLADLAMNAMFGEA